MTVSMMRSYSQILLPTACNRDPPTLLKRTVIKTKVVEVLWNVVFQKVWDWPTMRGFLGKLPPCLSRELEDSALPEEYTIDEDEI
jgi:hypothetical protein